jgi:hypothetical protein
MFSRAHWPVLVFFMIGCIAAVLIAMSVFALGLPPYAPCFTDNCKEGREWFSTIVTFAVILGGLYQYWNAQRWKRAEWVAAETESFFGDPKVMNALYMLDWNERRLPLLLATPESKRDYFTFEAELLLTAFYSKSTIPRDPNTGEEREFTEDELAVRDSFDRMLGRLERFEIFLEQRLVSFVDLQPYIAYWIDLIGDRNYGRKSSETIDRLWQYIDDYGFDKVQRLCRRFGYEIRPIQ